MGGVLVLAQFQIHPHDADIARRHYRELNDTLLRVKGFGGHILCVRHDDPTQMLAITRYSDYAAAERGLVVVAGATLGEKLKKDDGMIPQVGRYEIAHESGKTGLGCEIGEYVSMTLRNAEPGYNEELSEELQTIFIELANIPGFRGHSVGFHETLPEQTLSLAAWSSVEAFSLSLPDGRIHDVTLYKRVV